MNIRRVFGYTLGCRLNSYETEALLEEFRRRCGMQRVTDPAEADLIIVNTCAVTGRSTARSRKAVRSYLRTTGAEVVVTGCVVQVTPEEFAGQRVILLPNTSKSRVVDIVAQKLGVDIRPKSISRKTETIFPACAPEILSRTRAFLKVQDGCGNNCTYCIVPAARGDSRSQPREVVISQARRLSDSGFREILLTGVDLVAYGTDLYEGSYGLSDLVRDLLRIGGFRLRLSSMEPIGLRSEMLQEIAYPGVCRHLHIPVQSGSDRILEEMGRKYTSGDIRRLFDTAGQLFPGVCIGSDVIVGFPGETEEDFNSTVELISHPAVAYLHVFPFSPRPGTPAAEMTDRMLHPETITERARLLRKLSGEKRRAFRESQLGHDVLVLVESRVHEESGRYIGMTDNYIPVKVPHGSREGDMLEMTLEHDDVCWDRR
jgi:threonylcarbamoyladenosine tRNA methylthiotransferase MtaB